MHTLFTSQPTACLAEINHRFGGIGQCLAPLTGPTDQRAGAPANLRSCRASDSNEDDRGVPGAPIYSPGRFRGALTVTQITLNLPDELAQQAQRAGLLQSDTLAALLREAMQKTRVQGLFDTMERLRVQPPALTEEEIAAEIQAARAERRERNASRH